MKPFSMTRLAILFGIVLSNSVNAQTTSPEPGTVFIYSDARVERFVRSEGDVRIWRTRRGHEYARPANPAAPVQEWRIDQLSGTRTVIGDIERLWPPSPGQTARFRVLTEVESAERPQRSVQAWTCRTGQPEILALAGADFRTLPIRCDRYSVHTMRPLQRRTWWWSEELGHYIQRRYENLKNGDTHAFRLCATLPARRASQARIEAIVENGCE